MRKKYAGKLHYVLILLLATNFVFAALMIRAQILLNRLEQKAKLVSSYESSRLEYESRIEYFENEIEKYINTISLYEKALSELKEEKDKAEELNKLMTPAYNRWNLYEERYGRTDRSSYPREQAIAECSPSKLMRVTAYTEYECDKEPDHPLFGITASGNRVHEWFTVAAGREIPFGTRIYIPYFKDQINNGIFVVEDRGGAIKENCIDIYLSDQNAVDQFGVKWLEVYILE